MDAKRLIFLMLAVVIVLAALGSWAYAGDGGGPVEPYVPDAAQRPQQYAPANTAVQQQIEEPNEPHMIQRLGELGLERLGEAALDAMDGEDEPMPDHWPPDAVAPTHAAHPPQSGAWSAVNTLITTLGSIAVAVIGSWAAVWGGKRIAAARRGTGTGTGHG